MDKKKKDECIPQRDKLVKEARDQYFQELSTINNVGSYKLNGKEWSSDLLLPQTTTLNISNYLVFGISAYMSEI